MVGEISSQRCRRDPNDLGHGATLTGIEPKWSWPDLSELFSLQSDRFLKRILAALYSWRVVTFCEPNVLVGVTAHY